MVHPNKSPLNILEKRERGRIQGLPNFFGYPQGRLSLSTDGANAPWAILGGIFFTKGFAKL